jgi:hypothetical protein
MFRLYQKWTINQKQNEYLDKTKTQTETAHDACASDARIASLMADNDIDIETDIDIDINIDIENIPDIDVPPENIDVDVDADIDNVPDLPLPLPLPLADSVPNVAPVMNAPGAPKMLLVIDPDSGQVIEVVQANDLRKLAMINNNQLFDVVADDVPLSIDMNGYLDYDNGDGDGEDDNADELFDVEGQPKLEMTATIATADENDYATNNNNDGVTYDASFMNVDVPMDELMLSMNNSNIDPALIQQFCLMSDNTADTSLL